MRSVRTMPPLSVSFETAIDVEASLQTCAVDVPLPDREFWAGTSAGSSPLSKGEIAFAPGCVTYEAA